MNKIFKKITTLVMMFGMMMSYVIPFKTVLAAEPAGKENYGRIQINGATNLEDVSNAGKITATFAHGIVEFTAAGLYSDGNNEIYAIGEVTVTATPSENYAAQLWADGTNLNTNTTTVTTSAGSFVNMDAIFEENATAPNPGSNPVENQNSSNKATANITISAGEGSYKITKRTPDGEKIVDQEYDDMADFYINGSMWNPGDATISYNSSNADDKVTFTFETLWINRYYDDIVINGTSYKVSDYLDFDDRTEWLIANHGTQVIAFDIPNVPKADNYNIVVKHGENNGKKYFATFLWTADPKQADGYDYIGHSKLEFVKAEYVVGDKTYVVTGDSIENKMVKEGNFYTYNSEDGFLSYGVTAGVDYDDGSLTLPGNAKVTMRVVPEYGYQVTSVNGDGKFTTTDSGVSEFTIVVPEGAAGYFQAEVTKVDDEVEANSKNVASGNVEIVAGDIDSGTVRLSVDDVELSSDKIKDFEKAAGDYNITNYLDINLNKVLYKGTADDVWSEQIHHLKNKALITLQLEDGVDVSNIVIVHNIDDGEEFEVIEIESYDPETNTITFYTDSFSNYAIATKTKTKQETKKNPKTGDGYTNLMFGLMISLTGLVGVYYTHKKRLVKEQ